MNGLKEFTISNVNELLIIW